MKTILVIIIYVIVVLLFSHSQIRKNWIVFFAFMAGFYADIIII